MDFAEKLSKKAGGALLNFPRFALTQCTGWYNACEAGDYKLIEI